MKKNLSHAIEEIIVLVIVIILSGYGAWINFLSFYSSSFLDWVSFDFMVVALFVSGLFVGVLGSRVLTIFNRMEDARKEQATEPPTPDVTPANL